MSAKILVVEDEIIVADHLCNLLNKLGYITLEPCLSYSEAIESIQSNFPDLIMIDIHLAGQKDGIQLAKWINHNTKLPFLYLTSNLDQQTVQQAKEEKPQAFLAKPFINDEIKFNVENILKSFHQSPNFEMLFLKDGKKTVKISPDEIQFLKSAHVYLEFYTTKRKIVIRGSLADYLEKLPHIFLQTHRSYVINKNFVDSFDAKSITINGFKIPISAGLKARVFKEIDPTN